MKTKITLQQAYDMLSLCPVVELEGQLLDTQVYDITGEPTNVFLSLSWTETVNEQEVLVLLTFQEKDNLSLTLQKNVLTLISSEDNQKEELTLYTPLFRK